MSDESGYATAATSGVLWMTAQRWFSRIAGLLTILVLARLLDPSEFGLVAIALSVIPFVYLLADLGFSAYLVQVENPRPADFSTAFLYSGGAGLVLAALLGVAGSELETMLRVPGLAAVMWGLTPAVVCVALGAVPTAILRRRMRFRTIALQAFAAGLAGQLAAVALALLGYGVWALVAQTVITQLVAAVSAWVAAAWRPTREFSRGEFAKMVRYGANVVLVEISAMTRLWAENAIVVVTLGTVGLGYLSIAQRLIQVAQDLTATAVTPVSTVVFAQIRTNRARVAGGYARAQSVVYAIVIPVMVFVAAGAADLVVVLFGHQWEPSAAPARALAIAGILTLGASLDNGLFYGLGNPGRWLRYAVIVDALTVVATLVLARHGLGAVAVGFVVIALLATLMRWPMVARALGIDVGQLAGPFVRASAMGTCLYGVGWLAGTAAAPLPRSVVLLIQGAAIGCAWLPLLRWCLGSAETELRAMTRSLTVRFRPPAGATSVPAATGGRS